MGSARVCVLVAPQGLIQGRGTMRYEPAGDVYTGYWLHGMRHGPGEYKW